MLKQNIAALPRWLVVAALVLTTGGLSTATAQTVTFRDKFISLGTAIAGGTAFDMGAAFCSAVNADRSKTFIRCVPYATTGFEYNVKAVSYGALTMGFTSSSIMQDEYRQQGDGALGNRLRLVMNLYPLPVAVIAHRSDHIRDASQLAGHSINIGNPGSGARTISDTLLRLMKLSRKDFSQVTELNINQANEAFCSGKVDVLVQDLAHPSPVYAKLINQCDGMFVVFPPAMIDAIVAGDTRLSRMTIPGGIYKGYPTPQPAFGYRGVLVTSEDVSSMAVQRFLASAVKDLPEIRRKVPLLGHLQESDMFRTVGEVPLHQGVIDYLASRQDSK